MVKACWNIASFPLSEFSGDVDSLELGDMVEYSLSKGKGNKISAEKVNKTHSGSELWLLLLPPLILVGDKSGGRVVRPSGSQMWSPDQSIQWQLIRSVCAFDFTPNLLKF